MVPLETNAGICPTIITENMEKDVDGSSKASELQSAHTYKEVLLDNFSTSNPEMDKNSLHSEGNDIARNSSSTVPTEALARRKDSKILETCELCGGIGDTENMLICDNCEKAFHVSCHIPKHKPLPFDDWFCKNCMRLRNKVSLDAAFQKSRCITGGTESSRIGMDRITRMLRYPDPYTTRVRIGNTFQAEVPLWADQNPQDLDDVDEPLELNLAEAVCLCDIPKLKSSKNWLQCRRIEVVKVRGRRKHRRIACGKWRRAPFSEVQTDDWECFCAVRWDPAHADCAVPQEEDTEKVMKDLKLIEKLKSRLSEKREK
ncbi:hypothetical protein K2173_000306 [Erythroxylum novogranatense]|uniref:Uncharacterized protein n=1 Tax=Erythroxylum novogranatense TaxID=1862640 RepID=A0AAV8SWU3_9ROSI|nr:hypothetical protein K2173_000306 [Erythroxylum novogranatense]